MPDESKVMFDELNLKKAFTCALLMSHIDGQVHEKELALILRFVNEHWKTDYQDLTQVRADIEEEIKPYLIESIAFKGMISEFVDNLTKQMSDAQKVILLNLVEDTMMADGIMTSEEEALFETFKRKLRIEKD
ncbi:MAG: TerB family tellurite resistance protein [Proteobacteria bacterium]|nr:TerB family tellurite resistance protein [Pseudomonadota bacterium]